MFTYPNLCNDRNKLALHPFWPLNSWKSPSPSSIKHVRNFVPRTKLGHVLCEVSLLLNRNSRHQRNVSVVARRVTARRGAASGAASQAERRAERRAGRAAARLAVTAGGGRASSVRARRCKEQTFLLFHLPVPFVIRTTVFVSFFKWSSDMRGKCYCCC